MVLPVQQPDRCDTLDFDVQPGQPKILVSTGALQYRCLTDQVYYRDLQLASTNPRADRAYYAHYLSIHG